MDKAREIQRLLRWYHVAVHDVQRIAGLPHVQASERAPGAADGKKRAPFAGLEQIDVLEGLPDDLLCLLHRLGGNILQREAAQRQRDAGFHPVAVHLGELEGAAAEITRNPVRLVET